jgi:hypothetical protein
VGQDVSMVLDAYGNDVTFPWLKLPQSIQPKLSLMVFPVYETKVSFNQADARIRSGMTATATIIAHMKKIV